MLEQCGLITEQLDEHSQEFLAPASSISTEGEVIDEQDDANRPGGMNGSIDVHCAVGK